MFYSFSYPDEPNDTAKKYRVKNHIGTFAFITTIIQPFCNSYNRLRLTADGKVKNCLFSQGETDILGTYRKGEDIESLILSCLITKKEALGGNPGFSITENRTMIKIGG